MPLRLYRAWRLYIRLNYSWHLAWHKAAYRPDFFSAHRDPRTPRSSARVQVKLS
jgi:hypothetical protein